MEENDLTKIMWTPEDVFPHSSIGHKADLALHNRLREEILKTTIEMEERLISFHAKSGRINKIKKIAWNITVLIILFLLGVFFVVCMYALVDLIKGSMA